MPYSSHCTQCFLLFFLGLTVNTANSKELRSTLQDQQGVAVTIYNENLALVKDQRQIQLGSGQSTLAFRDVSAQMRPETALLRSLSSPGKLSVIEQNFDFDLLTPQKLLEKYVGKSVMSSAPTRPQVTKPASRRRCWRPATV